MAQRAFGLPAVLSEKYRCKIVLKNTEKNEKYRLPYFDQKRPILLMGDTIEGTVTLPLNDSKSFKYEDLTIEFQQKASDRGRNEVALGFTQKFVIGSGKTVKKETTEPFTLKIDPKSIGASYYGKFFELRYSINAYLSVGAIARTTSLPIYVLHVSEHVPKPLNSVINDGSLFSVQLILDDEGIDPSRCVIGKLLILDMRLRIVNVKLEMICTEKYFGATGAVERGVIGEYEIADGSCVKGTVIPIRWFMPGLRLWPPTKGAKGAVLEAFLAMKLVFKDATGKRYSHIIAKDFDRWIQ